MKLCTLVIHKSISYIYTIQMFTHPFEYYINYIPLHTLTFQYIRIYMHIIYVHNSRNLTIFAPHATCNYSD